MNDFYWQHKPGIDCEITDRNHALLVKERDELKERLRIEFEGYKADVKAFIEDKAKLKARVRRYEKALKDILNPHPHGITYTWRCGNIINGRVKKCHAIEIAKQALAEQEGK